MGADGIVQVIAEKYTQQMADKDADLMADVVLDVDYRILVAAQLSRRWASR